MNGYQIANEYALDNDRLREEKEELTATLRQQKDELDLLRTKLSNAELLALHRPQPTPAIAPLSPDDPEADDSPKQGEIRYYKKTRSTPHCDVMVIFGGCNHNNWESANKADKARKGVEKLEGRNDWSSFYHCATCTGGGVWKVKW